MRGGRGETMEGGNDGGKGMVICRKDNKGNDTVLNPCGEDDQMRASVGGRTIWMQHTMSWERVS